MEKSAKFPSSQLKVGRFTAGTACPNTGNPGSNRIKFILFFGILLFRVPQQAGILSDPAITAVMAGSWFEALALAREKNLPQVYHDCDTDIFGACHKDEPQGSFRNGIFSEHRCICMPATHSPEELAEKERKFRIENPDW